jgi:uncharacterized DUF497 family protein
MKAAENAKKHTVDFEEATTVFGDPGGRTQGTQSI